MRLLGAAGRTRRRVVVFSEMLLTGGLLRLPWERGRLACIFTSAGETRRPRSQVGEGAGDDSRGGDNDGRRGMSGVQCFRASGDEFMGFFGFLRPHLCRPRISCAIAGVAVAAAINGAAAQTAIKFSLDFKFEGPSAPFLVGIDKGYYQAEGLNVTIDGSAGALEPITRVASGAYDMGFGDINSLIKVRDQNPNVPIKAVFMVYNRPPFSIVTRKRRTVTLPKDLQAKKLGAPAADGAFAQWKIFVHANGIDASKVAIENVGIPIREPMLAAGQVDAITPFSFSSYLNLKDPGVPIHPLFLPPLPDSPAPLHARAH